MFDFFKSSRDFVALDRQLTIRNPDGFSPHTVILLMEPPSPVPTCLPLAEFLNQAPLARHTILGQLSCASPVGQVSNHVGVCELVPDACCEVCSDCRLVHCDHPGARAAGLGHTWA